MRFNTATYAPAQDSSPDTAHLRTGAPGTGDEPGFDGVILLTTVVVDGETRQACGCGCTVPVKNSDRMFVQGHDQRLRGILTRAHLAEVEITRIDGGSALTSSALQLAISMDADRPLGKRWADGLRAASALEIARQAAKADRQARRASVSRETDAAVEKAAEIGQAEAEAAHVETAPEPTFRDGTVKVGRWTYPARAWEGGVTERNEKRNGNGAWVEIDAADFVPAG